MPALSHDALNLNTAQVGKDHGLLERLAAEALSDYGLTTCCALLIRYENSGPATSTLAAKAQQVLEDWGLERRAAFRQARQLWFAGYRPSLDAAPVGSGSDVEA